MITTTKKEMAEMIINSHCWDGTRSVENLVKNSSYQELKEIYVEILEMEN